MERAFRYCNCGGIQRGEKRRRGRFDGGCFGKCDSSFKSPFSTRNDLAGADKRAAVGVKIKEKKSTQSHTQIGSSGTQVA